LPDAAVWSASPAPRAGAELLVLLHGHGGVEDDLTPLFPMLPETTLAVALRGTVSLGDRWTWFDGHRQPLTVFDQSVEQVRAWVDEVWDDRPVGVLGFSLGGAVALELLRRAPDRFAYAGQICGFRMPGRRDDCPELAHRRPPVFSGVGERDDVISVDDTREMTEWLRRHTEVSEHRYPHLGHEIADAMLQDAASFVIHRPRPSQTRPA
jgi:phospholipase/carboxylesterase